MRTSGDRKSYMVECYWPGVSEETLTGALRGAEEAATELRVSGADVALVGSILAPGDETVFLFFQGNEEDIRATALRAGIPFERVVESQWSAATGAGSRPEEDRR